MKQYLTWDGLRARLSQANSSHCLASVYLWLHSLHPLPFLVAFLTIVLQLVYSPSCCLSTTKVSTYIVNCQPGAPDIYLWIEWIPGTHNWYVPSSCGDGKLFKQFCIIWEDVLTFSKTSRSAQTFESVIRDYASIGRNVTFPPRRNIPGSRALRESWCINSTIKIWTKIQCCCCLSEELSILSAKCISAQNIHHLFFFFF